MIKDGRESMQMGGTALPHMVFQSRMTPEELANAVPRHLDSIRPMLFVPGSSLRGAWRSHLEKVLRSLDEVPKVCDPFIGSGSEDQDPACVCQLDLAPFDALIWPHLVFA
jgi:CRISPR/Cas system CSM-associated protein Csm3 (group 7 of RAMP superfamily)